MSRSFPSSILFCCDHNSVRSPMAEGLMKNLYGRTAYVQSAGVRNDMEIDGFAITVCNEIGVELCRHRSRSFEEMQTLGDNLGSFDLVVALSPTSQRQAMELARNAYVEVEYWPIMDPVGQSEGREATLALYRAARNEIQNKLTERFGPPSGASPVAEERTVSSGRA